MFCGIGVSNASLQLEASMAWWHAYSLGVVDLQEGPAKIGPDVWLASSDLLQPGPATGWQDSGMGPIKAASDRGGGPGLRLFRNR